MSNSEVLGVEGPPGIPLYDEFLEGIREYEGHEKRDPMYRVARFLVDHFWGKPADMADALGVLLLTWNQAFYRYGGFEFEALEDCIREAAEPLDCLRGRNIQSWSSADGETVGWLFTHFMDALAVRTPGGLPKRSPVSAAKALHVLAPAFLPLWDHKIAWKYGCRYEADPVRAYIKFCSLMRDFALKASEWDLPADRTLLKLIDQYNYSRYSKGWI